ncbi:MAG TPA: ABC transporter permease [Methanocella sp.]
MSENVPVSRMLTALKIKIGLEQIAVTGLLVALLLVSVYVPDVPAQMIADQTVYLGVVIALLAIYLLGLALAKDNYRKTSDIFLILVIFLLLWEVTFAKLGWFNAFLFPSPERVFQVFADDNANMIEGIVSSYTILLQGYFLALIVAIPLALWVGWKKRAFEVAYPIAKAVSPIPPTVYLPYSIVLLPTFSAASIFVIFVGAFWPVFVSTVYGVFNIDRRIVNSAKALGLKEHVLLRKVLLPAAMPSIFSGALISLILSFVTLTVAEMIAATSGLGWYIQYQHEFGNNDRVVAGMILMAACVIVTMWVFDRVQKYCLRWQTPQ